MSWFPLNFRSQFSLLTGLHQPKDIVTKCKELGYTTVGLTDDGSLAGTVEFYQSCKSQGVKPIIGCHFNGYYLVANSLIGWKNLIKHQVDSSHSDYDGLLYIATSSEKLEWAINILGKGCLFAGLEPFDGQNINMMRLHAYNENIPTIPLCSPYYLSQENQIDQNLLVCLKDKKSLADVKKGRLDPSLLKFFDQGRYSLKNEEELRKVFVDKEIDNLSLLLDRVEDFNILSRPKMPVFKTPSGELPDDYLRELAQYGWYNKIEGKVDAKRYQEYVDRMAMELSVIKETCLLANQLLVVRDYIEAAKKRGELVGLARGSAASSLVSYLVGVTGFDPIPHDLVWERFYNQGRNTKDKVSLADIDVDFEMLNRHKTVNYLKETYGGEKVAHMATYGREMGRGALKDVLRTHSACSFDEMNRMTEFIPDEAAISDELQEMREEGEEASIILWALQNNASQLSEWCKLTDSGKLDGPFSYYFAQAIRLEGTKKSQSKHASGVIVSNEDLLDFCPMAYDKNGELVCSPPMNDIEAIGGVKMDVLATKILDKMSGWERLMRKEKVAI